MKKNKILFRWLGIAAGLLIASSAAFAKDMNKPNLLLIVADDLGYSDIGAFGGEIDTPNLDALADSGIRLAEFHTAPTCSPARSMLLSGIDSHQAGFGNMAELITEEQKGKPGYEGYLNEAVATLPEVLRDNGYNTYMVGKWHLGRTEEQSPAARGFDKSFALIQGGASHFNDQRAIIGADPTAIYRKDGKSVGLPKDFYSSDSYTDMIIDYIDKDSGSGKPFFAYVAYTAPHWPLHAPDTYLNKYEGRYEEGYEAVRQNRLKKMKEMGLVGHKVSSKLAFEELPSWNELTDEQQKIESKKMEVYAAMVDNMDHNIGRLLNHLEAKGEIENTVILFMSDNGADGNSPEVLPKNKEWIATEFDNSLENMGRPNSYVWYGPQWGQVGTTPFPIFKGFTAQGGIQAPAIVKIPGVHAKNEINRTVFSVMDVMPTFLDLAGIEVPKSPYNNREIYSIQGLSMLAALNDESADKSFKSRTLGWELFGRSAVRKGDWKIELHEVPYGTGTWQLFNLAVDPAATTDLASSNPEKLKEMLVEWKSYVDLNGVLASDPEKMKKIGYSFTTCHYGKCVE